MTLLLIIALFIWAWVDSGFTVAIELVIVIGLILWMVQLATGGLRKALGLVNQTRNEIHLTQNNYREDHPDPTRPDDEHPLLQLHREYRRRH